MRAVILQPSYLPWLGYFEQLHQADVFVVYDNVQFDKHGWRNRNRIRTKEGTEWLTVPVQTKGRSGQRNNEVRISEDGRWKKKQLGAIRQHYGMTKAFDLHYPQLERVILCAHGWLLDLNLELLHLAAGWLGLERKVCLSSDLGVLEDLNPTERLVEICRAVGASSFYEGASGRNYIEEERFACAGIQLAYQDYAHPVYAQQYPGFVSHLSVIDLLFNHGEESMAIILNQGVHPLPSPPLFQ